jgi:pimeloyl-ACP methyl ester carboxylesterase
LVLRALATDSSLAILGTSETGVPDHSATDQQILSALGTAASVSNRPEVGSAFLLLVGISGGAPEAFGFTVRLPGRIAALLLRVPSNLLALPLAESRLVPTYMVLAENDVTVSNQGTTFVFETNRALRALWGMAVEPGTVHFQLTAESQAVQTSWLKAMVGLRLPAAAGGALRSVSEDAGWLGNRSTNAIAPFATYTGDPLVASWLPTAAVAQEWRDLVTP